MKRKRQFDYYFDIFLPTFGPFLTPTYVNQQKTGSAVYIITCLGRVISSSREQGTDTGEIGETLVVALPVMVLKDYFMTVSYLVKVLRVEVSCRRSEKQAQEDGRLYPQTSLLGPHLGFHLDWDVGINVGTVRVGRFRPPG